MCGRISTLRLALAQLHLEVFSHDPDQVPDYLQIDILGELRQAQKDSTQMH